MKEEGGERRKMTVLAKAVERWLMSLLGQQSRTRRPVAAGYFTVLVGPEKERFAVPARRASHQLFRALLDEAEAEYGFPGCRGPLELPCAVDAFMEVMWEMEQQADPTASPGCACRLLTRRGHYQMMSPARFLVRGR